MLDKHRREWRDIALIPFVHEVAIISAYEQAVAAAPLDSNGVFAYVCLILAEKIRNRLTTSLIFARTPGHAVKLESPMASSTQHIDARYSLTVFPPKITHVSFKPFTPW
jgi:hypothetical protein